MARTLILYLLSLTVRSLLFAGLAAVAAAATRKVQTRHAIWTLVLCFLFLAPVADGLIPSGFVPDSIPKAVHPIQTFIVYSPGSVARPASTETVGSVEFRMDPWTITTILILGVMFVLLFRFTLALGAVARLRRASSPVSHPLWEGLMNISIRESKAITVPLTVGFWNPAVILPVAWRDWDEWKLGAVLTHERTHIRRRDWAIALIAGLGKCVFWFNPLVWWLDRKLSSLAEQACDEASLQACGDAPRYAETLLEFASDIRHGHRWMGGVAMAQHKISLRIERILALRRPGSGVLSHYAWMSLLLLTLPVLYVSAASQKEKAPALRLNPGEFAELLQPLLPAVATVAPRQQPVSPQTPQPPTNPAPRDNGPATAPPGAPQDPSQQVAPTTNPDLVGEIRLILAPVDAAIPGQIEWRTRGGTNRWSGTAIWSFANSAISPASWGSNATFAFALTRIDGRKALFEDRSGNTFSYGCPDCTFFVSQSGVGLLPVSPDTGIAFQLGADGKSLSATCHATECRTASLSGTAASPFAGSVSLTLRNSQTATIGIAQSPSWTCFNPLGNSKADGSPFTSEDCERGAATAVLFSVTR